MHEQDPTAGSVTQTATAYISNATEKFFKAAIEPQHAEEPWEE